MRSVSAVGEVALEPDEALELWTDLKRWPSFVEGFARTLEVGEAWPAEGAKVVWESTPDGRGRVTEKVLERGPGRFVTEVYEDRLQGRQSISVREGREGTRVELGLEYDLAGEGPFQGVTDVLFIRRALRDALRRTLGRFRVEAEEEAGLR